ncbi:hypothetical protein NUW58_g2226 [Xylaria curta]|uniref:Uncharacterized protein n=1 Tax=Xylaria curta TaxID=42375 RepID=A0ACC1PH56_9PEZI|nr:hypothetical protein NUW58_g2226 [Xylaria curta]
MRRITNITNELLGLFVSAADDAYIEKWLNVDRENSSDRARRDVILRVHPTKPITHPQVRHAQKRKISILFWLTDNRVIIIRANQAGEPHIISSVRSDHVHPTREEHPRLTLAFRGNGVIYRSPTCVEAAAFWKMEKTAPGSGIPESASRPQVFPEQNNTADVNDDNESDVVELPPSTSIGASDDSDIEPDDDDGEPLELDAEARPAHTEHSDSYRSLQSASGLQGIRGEPNNNSLGEDADGECIPEADMDGTE